MADQHTPDWVIVWQEAGPGADMRGDLIVSLLEGSNLPVVRIPPATAPIIFDGASGPLMPVRVLVPPDREADAKELLADVATDLTPDEDEQ